MSVVGVVALAVVVLFSLQYTTTGHQNHITPQELSQKQISWFGESFLSVGHRRRCCCLCLVVCFCYITLQLYCQLLGSVRHTSEREERSTGPLVVLEAMATLGGNF